MIIGIGPTAGMKIEWGGHTWTLLDVLEVDYSGVDIDTTPREPHVMVEDENGQEGEMYWRPLFAWEIDEYDWRTGIVGVIICEDD